VSGPFVCRCLISLTMLRFHLPLVKPDGRISRIRLSDKDAVTSSLMLSLAREVDRHQREPHLLPIGSRRPRGVSTDRNAPESLFNHGRTALPRSKLRGFGPPTYALAPNVTGEFPSLGHATPSAALGLVAELVGSSPVSGTLATYCVVLELRPLRSAGITRLLRYYEPLRHPTRPSLSLTGVSLAVTRRHRWGFPRLPRFSLQACHRHYPGGTEEPCHSCLLPTRPRSVYSPAAAFPDSVAGRLPRCAFRGLLGVHSRYGLLARGIA
jgi:hypothetical protein